MAEIPDNEFEKAFQKAATGHEPAFDPKAWEMMEAKLDREDRKAFWWRTGILLLLLLLVVGIGSWFYLGSFSSDLGTVKDGEGKSKLQEEVVARDDIKKDDISSDNKGLKEEAKPEEKNKRSANDFNADKNSLSEAEKIKKEVAKDGIEEKGNKGGSSKPEDTSGNKIIKNILTNKDEVDTGKSIIEDDKSKNTIILPDSLKEEHEGVERAKDVDRLINEAELWVLEDCMGCEAILPTIEQEKMPETEHKKAENNRRLLVGLTIAPDLSGINFGGNRLGARTSLGLEYEFTNRLYITTGLGISKKRYFADISEYSTPVGFWMNGEVPNAVDADCNVLEIPIGLRYDWWVRDRKRLFLTSSISSFWMLKELYEYEYDENYSPPPGSRTSWLGRNENKHMFSIWQAGIGYEANISSKLSFQIEPFVQVPLGEVGFGKVDLTSFGTHFTVKYLLK